MQSTATVSDINKGPAKGHGPRSRVHPASSTVRSSCRRYEQGDQLVANNFKAIQALHAARRQALMSEEGRAQKATADVRLNQRYRVPYRTRGQQFLSGGRGRAGSRLLAIKGRQWLRHTCFGHQLDGSALAGRGHVHAHLAAVHIHTVHLGDRGRGEVGGGEGHEAKATARMNKGKKEGSDTTTQAHAKVRK